MTSVRLASVLARVLAAAVLVASGTYLLVYLYRWEWNRAVISGVFFLGAEVALGFSMVLARLRRLEQRMDERPVPVSAPARAQVAAAAPPPPPAPEEDGRPPFAWLDPTGGGFGVFVPVLMGAGVVLSAIAFVIERLAASVAGTTRSRAPARPGTILVGAASLVPSGGGPAEPALPMTGAHRNPVATAVALLIGGLLVVAAVDTLGDATQTRPTPLGRGTTTIELLVGQKDFGSSEVKTAEALFVACQGVLPGSIRHARVEAAGPGRVTMTVDAVLGELRQRRLVGCLQDATLDLVKADVVGVLTRAA